MAEEKKGNDYIASLKKILREDRRYDIEAYVFLSEALAHLINKIGEKRHVTGQELLEGIRELALRKYGPLSLDVLEHWGVHRCEDFGEIVFNLVNKGLLSKTEKDSKDDFKGGYDFREAFEKPFQGKRGEGND